MAKKKQPKLLSWVMWIVGILVSLGIAGLFINGTFMDTFLSFFGQTIHSVVGYIIIATTFWKAIQEIL